MYNKVRIILTRLVVYGLILRILMLILQIMLLFKSFEYKTKLIGSTAENAILENLIIAVPL